MKILLTGFKGREQQTPMVNDPHFKGLTSQLKYFIHVNLSNDGRIFS